MGTGASFFGITLPLTKTNNYCLCFFVGHYNSRSKYLSAFSPTRMSENRLVLITSAVFCKRIQVTGFKNVNANIVISKMKRNKWLCTGYRRISYTIEHVLFTKINLKDSKCWTGFDLWSYIDASNLCSDKRVFFFLTYNTNKNYITSIYKRNIWFCDLILLNNKLLATLTELY